MSTTVPNDHEVDRRRFLKTALAATAGAVAATAVTTQLAKDGATIVSTVPSLPPVETGRAISRSAVVAAEGASEMMQQLVAAHAHNLKLQTELDSAQRKLLALTHQADRPDVLNQALESRLTESELKLGIVAGLVSLYEQLESIDLEETVDAGLATLGGSISALVGQLPDVDQALAAGQQALADLEAEIPLVDSGRRWLDAHLDRLGQSMESLETVLRDAVDEIGPLLQMLSQWFEKVLKWLPFGMGATAAAVVEAATGLLGATPQAISGLRTNVSQPLDLWLKEENGEQPIRSRLVRPLREKTIASAAKLSLKAGEVETTYRSDLSQPVSNVIQTRRQVRELIAAYRNQHQI